MSVKELPTFPQTTLSETQGLVGIRQWQLDRSEDMDKFCDWVCKSHWPKYPDAIPVQVQSGAWNNDTVTKCAGELTQETMGPLPEYGAYKVVAHYALHRMSNCWPKKIPKPWHPKGTTLSLKIHGSGQVLLVTPAGMKTMHTPGQVCNPKTPVENQSAMFFSRILVPVTEYHITCSRMTKEQVDDALKYRDWDNYQGCVNIAHEPHFLGAEEGTLLFDGYEMTEGFACDPKDPLRYSMTACLKQRVIVDEKGKTRKDRLGYYIGWNHDFVANTSDKNGYGWTLIKVQDGGHCRERYQRVNFQWMFGGLGQNQDQPCDPCPTDATPLTERDLCGPFNPCDAGGGGGSGSGGGSQGSGGAGSNSGGS